MEGNTIQQQFQNAARKTALIKAKAVREQLAHKQQSDREARKSQIDGMLSALGRAVTKFEIADANQQYDLRQTINDLNLEFYRLEASDLPLLEEIIVELEATTKTEEQ